MLDTSKTSQNQEYAPIYNSKRMVNEIEYYAIRELPIEDFSREMSAKLNVGLLAAKALEFDDAFKDYALALHTLWDQVIQFSQSNKLTPLNGNKKIAYDFYEAQGMSQAEIPGHLAGIDFSQPIYDDYLLVKGSVVKQ